MSGSRGSGTELATQLGEALEPVVAHAGLFLEDVAVVGSPARRVVRVTVDLADGPGGVGSDLLSDVSHAVSAKLDELEHLIDGAYLLEVSTPGVSRPLTQARHFRRAQARLVTLSTAEGEIVGRLTSATADDVTLVVGEGTKAQRTEVIPLASISQGRVEVELNRVADLPQPDDAAPGADDDADDDDN